MENILLLLLKPLAVLNASFAKVKNPVGFMMKI